LESLEKNFTLLEKKIQISVKFFSLLFDIHYTRRESAPGYLKIPSGRYGFWGIESIDTLDKKAHGSKLKSRRRSYGNEN
jgi:hypothetical protein